ncbi:MAG: phosphotransferase [Dehalococcoidia bacterium]|nr:phosphotransferase [Dehalococcoidia bacterium]
MQDLVELVLGRLRAQLASDNEEWGVTRIEIAGAGMQFLVFRAESRAFGPIAIRTPMKRWITDDNDPCMDSRDLLRQEAALASHMRIFGVPVPKVHALVIEDDGLDFLVSEYILHDETAYDDRQLGELVRLIHECPLSDIRLAAQTDVSTEETIALRLSRRLRVVEARSGRRLSPPSLAEFRTILKELGDRRSTLHMDLRPNNILTRGGNIVGVADWDNALFGNPAIELARMAEYGVLNSDFLAGYGGLDWETELPTSLNLMLRLDAAVMLAIVFLSETPDSQRARSAVERVAFLCDALKGES